MGTSLTVHPFASLVDNVADQVPRVLINREAVGVHSPEERTMLRILQRSEGFVFDEEARWRDVVRCPFRSIAFFISVQLRNSTLAHSRL